MLLFSPFLMGAQESHDYTMYPRADPPTPHDTMTSSDGVVYDVYVGYEAFAGQNARTRSSYDIDREISMQICSYNNYGAFVEWHPRFTLRNVGRLPWASKWLETNFRRQSPAECRAALKPVPHYVRTAIRREK